MKRVCARWRKGEGESVCFASCGMFSPAKMSHREIRKFFSPASSSSSSSRSSSSASSLYYAVLALHPTRGGHARASVTCATTAAFIAARIRVRTHPYARTAVSRRPRYSATPNTGCDDTRALGPTHSRDVSPVPFAPPLFRVSRSVGAVRSENALSLPPFRILSLSPFPSAAHRRRPVIYSRSSGDGQSRRSRHACVASPRAVPSTRARHGAARRPLPRHSPTRLLARVYYLHSPPYYVRTQRYRARERARKRPSERMPSPFSFLRRRAFISR